tara:strand:+ start:11 stop:496 length:486 start_codon:yes stop_codon:yes gene_type:complete
VKYLSLFLVVLFSFSHSLQASNKTIEGYWLTSESIVEVKVCKEFICAEISHVFVEEGVDSSSVLDENNSNKDLQGRALIGINLFKEFKKELISKEVLKGGKIYNPRDGNFYKSTLALLKNGNLKIKGCVLFLCDGEEWQPLEVTFNADGSRQATLKSNQED